jgi:NADH:ubiquinone oxidoreductase subunit D
MKQLGLFAGSRKLMGVQPPERAEYLRVIMAELSRVQNHLILVGMLLNDLGAMFTPALYAFEERELILDIFEAASGARMMCNYHRFGGVARDLPEGVLEKIKGLVEDRLPRKVDEFERLLTENEIFVSRMRGVNVINGEDAVRYSITGPVLRAAGVPYDVRRAQPYGIYDRFDFDVALARGDLYVSHRSAWMRSGTLRILRQAVKQIRRDRRYRQARVQVCRARSTPASRRRRASLATTSCRRANRIHGATTCGRPPS